MKWIGLTGGIATGKSTVSRLLVSRGHAVIDADRLSREVVAPGTDGYREIVGEFGSEIVADNGEIHRKRVGEIVFQDRAKLARLEGIIHPRVRKRTEELRRELEAEGRDIAFYDVPLLFEKKMKPLFDRVVVVACSPDLQLDRLMKRDSLSLDEARKRISVQLPISEKARLSDDVIYNNGDLSDLERSVDAYLKKLG